MTPNQTIDGVPLADLEAALKADASRGATASELVAGWAAMERLRALLDARHPSEDELIASGLGYPFSKEEAVQLYYSGFKTEPITVLEAWDAIGHDIGCNPSKDELLESLRNMAAICDAHGNDMPAAQPQGDTVPVSAHWSDWSMVTLEIEGKRRTYVEFCKPLQKPVAWKTGSITWAYEPDARRHGDQHGVLVKPLYDRPDCREPDYYRIETPKTLVNGVPTEWFPAVMFYVKSQLPQDGVYRVIEQLYAEQPAPVAVADTRTPFEIEHDAEPGDEAAFRKWRDERPKK